MGAGQVACAEIPKLVQTCKQNSGIPVLLPADGKHVKEGRPKQVIHRKT